MKIIYDNSDISIKINFEGYKINYNLINNIDFIVYTTNVHCGITKKMQDVDINNMLSIDNSELISLESGVIKYYYLITNIDGSVYHNTVTTDYYLCHKSSVHPTYYTKNEIDAKLVNKSDTTHKHSEYVEDDVLGSYYTKNEINDLLDNFEVGDIDLSNYYTKEQTDALIPSTEGFIKEIPSEYITETELNNKGYLTQHQSLEGYAKLSDIPTDYIKSIPSEYITETELNEKGYITNQYDDTELTNRVSALESEISGVSQQINELNGMIV